MFAQMGNWTIAKEGQFGQGKNGVSSRGRTGSVLALLHLTWPSRRCRWRTSTLLEAGRGHT